MAADIMRPLQQDMAKVVFYQQEQLLLATVADLAAVAQQRPD